MIAHPLDEAFRRELPVAHQARRHDHVIGRGQGLSQQQGAIEQAEHLLDAGGRGREVGEGAQVQRVRLADQTLLI